MAWDYLASWLDSSQALAVHLTYRPAPCGPRAQGRHTVTEATYQAERAAARTAADQRASIARQVEAYCAGVAAQAAQATAAAMRARGHQAVAA